MIRDPENQQTPREKERQPKVAPSGMGFDVRSMIPPEIEPGSRAVDTVSSEEIKEEWRKAGREPTLEHVLADPIVQLVMGRDGIEIAELKAVIVQAQAGLDGKARDINTLEVVNDNTLVPL